MSAENTAASFFRQAPPLCEQRFDYLFADDFRLRITAGDVAKTGGEIAWENRGYIKGAALGISTILLSGCGSNSSEAVNINLTPAEGWGIGSGLFWALEEVFEKDKHPSVLGKVLAIPIKFIGGYLLGRGLSTNLQNINDWGLLENLTPAVETLGGAVIVAKETSIKALIATFFHATANAGKTAVNKITAPGRQHREDLLNEALGIISSRGCTYRRAVTTLKRINMTDEEIITTLRAHRWNV